MFKINRKKTETQHKVVYVRLNSLPHSTLTKMAQDNNITLNELVRQMVLYSMENMEP